MLTVERLKEMVNKIMTNPNEGPLVSIELIDEITGLMSVQTSTEAEVARLTQVNQDLTNTNMQLFMKMTNGQGFDPGKSQEVTEVKEPSPQESLQEAIDLIRNDGKEE